MGLFDSIRRAFSAPTMSHPRFGEITLMQFKNGATSYWEGWDLFRPTAKRVQVLIEGDTTGPAPEVVSAWDAIQDRYPSLWPAIESLLMAAYADWIPDANPETGRDRFTLDTVFVPRDPDSSQDWEFSFGCFDDEEHSFTVRMHGWEPQPDVGIEG